MSNRCLGVLALTMIVPLTARAQDVTTLERRLTQLDALRHNGQAAAVRAESTSRAPRRCGAHRPARGNRVAAIGCAVRHCGPGARRRPGALLFAGSSDQR